MTLYLISVVVMWSSLSSGNHGHDVPARPVELQCENCHCKGMTGEKCPFQKCRQLWHDCFSEQYNDLLFVEEYNKQTGLALTSFSTQLQNLHKYIMSMTFLAYSNKENVTVVRSKYIETTTEFQIFSTPSRKNEQSPVKSETNRSFESTVSPLKKIDLEPSKSVLANQTYMNNTVFEHENVLLVVDAGLVLLWITNVIFLCVCIHLRRPDSAKRQDVALNRIRIDNVGNTTNIIHEDSALLLNDNANDVEFVPVREPLPIGPTDGQNITQTITV